MNSLRPSVTGWSWHAASRRPPERAIALVRRGVHHGYVCRRRSKTGPEPGVLWKRGDAIYLRRIFADSLRRHADQIASTSRLFERLRRDADFSEELWRRLENHPRALPAGTSIDMGDAREIEKVHVDLAGGARDLYAKLSWITTEAEDESLRIRFSFGSEALDDWQNDVRRARAADRLAELVFPECAPLAGDRALARLLDDCSGSPIRLSERILFSNAPGGGARFHHDAEPGQLGVAYAQIQGATAWLALPKCRLAEISAPLDLDRPDDRLDRWLNSTPRLTRRLVEAGYLFVLRAGDLLLLPSPADDKATWHSVFALGKRPSLSWSFGVFSSEIAAP